MAITFTLQKKRRKYLVWVLAPSLLALSIFLWLTLSKPQSDKVSGPSVPLKFSKKIEINLDVFKNVNFQNLKIFEEMPFPTEKIGRENPFTPF